MDYCSQFKDKKITIIGLGLLGRAVNVTKFLAECGASIIVTDLKNEEDLKDSIFKLKRFKNISYSLGEHKEEDFIGRDIVIKSAGVSLDNKFINIAKEDGAQIEMDASLFAKLIPEGVTLVGVTGTRGKTTVAYAIHHILKLAGKSVYLAGNIRGVATLPLLEKVKSGDIVILELDSWQLQGFGDAKISPHIAVFTTFYPDHMNYYPDMETYFNDKANIFKYGNKEGHLILGHDMKEKISNYWKENILPKIQTVSSNDIPEDWNILIPGIHNKENIAAAIAVAKILDVRDSDIKEGVETFSGVEGRLQFEREINGVKIYNDNNSTTPEATIVGLRALNDNRNIILIIGGSDKGLDMSELILEIKKTCKVVILFNGSGTQKIKNEIMSLKDVKSDEADNLEESVKKAMNYAVVGDIVLYSPAFASFGKHFKNEYDRNDQFVDIVNSKI